VAIPTIHASAVLVGARAVVVRGPSGAGKSRLVLAVIEAAAAGRLAFARLVADDRVHVEAVHGRVIARPPAALAGLLEVRGLGIVRLPFEAAAAVALVVDLGVTGAPRLPDAAHARTDVAGVTLPRLAVPPGCDPLPLVLAAAATPGPAESGTGHFAAFQRPCAWPTCGPGTSVGR